MPAPGPVRIIGTPVAGCLAGAVRLPDHGPGFATVRQSMSRFWGAPVTIAGIERLGWEVQAAGLGTVYVEDISGPRGGPLTPHAGHQIGLEADIALGLAPGTSLSAAEREAVELPSLVRADQRDVDPTRWTEAAATLLHLAATLPRVDRVLVNPAIKRALCRDVTGDRDWLRLIRPWWGHAAHMHIRFRCPADQPACTEPPPPPEGDGCGASLAWWFAGPEVPPKPPSGAHRATALPQACGAVMAGSALERADPPQAGSGD